MKGNIRTRATHQFKYNDKYNNTYLMILAYVYIGFFDESYDKRSIRDICKRRAPHFIHEWDQRREYRIMRICRNIRNMHKFDRECRYMMRYMGDYYE